MSFEELRSLDPAFAQAVANLSQSYRALIRQIDPVLERAGVYDKPTLENLLQRTARQIVFAYEDEITQANFYDSVHLSTWLERVTSALGYLGPLLQSLRAGGGRNATLAERADTRRQQLLRDSRDLESMRFIREGKSSREKRAARELEEQRIAASVDFIRDFLRRVWQPNLSDQEGRLYGTVLVEHLVQRKHLNADEIREVLDRLRDEDPRLLRAALFRGGTVQALLAVGIGGLQAYRAEGEGFFAGAIRAERESVIAHPLGERVFSTGERVIAVLGFIAGVFQGIGDDIISNVKGIVELFTPSFWHGMRDFFRSFLPQFIDNEDFRFQLGQMMGKFSVDEERRLATADPFEYGLSFGHVFGMALVEIVLTFVGLGFVLKALRGSERLKRIARPLVALAKAIGRTALAARGLRFAQALGEAINALSRRLRRLTMLLPDLTPNARLRRTLFEMEEADRELQAAARRAHELEKLAREALAAGDEEAAQRHVKDLSEAADDLEGRVGGETPKPAEPVPEPAKPAAGVTGIPKEVEEDIADHFAHKYDAVSRELIKQVLDAYMGDSKVLFHVLEAWESESPKKAVHLATDTLGVARDLSHIEGIGIVFEDLASSSSRTARGAQFELKWILEHKNEVIRVAVPSATSPRFELKGLDVLTTGGSVELKDFNLASKFYSEAPELAAERVARQVERRVLEGDTKVHVVFSSDSGPMPAALKNALETRLNAVAQAHGLSPGALSFSLWP